MDNNKKFIEKSKKIRELFGFDKNCLTRVTPNKIHYNEQVYFCSRTEDKDQVSQIISDVINSINSNQVETTTQIKVNINISQNFFNSNINYIVHDVNKKETVFSDGKVSPTKSGNNYSIDNYSTHSTQVKQNNNNQLNYEGNNNQKTNFFVPCINCNNLIHLDDIGKIY